MSDHLTLLLNMGAVCCISCDMLLNMLSQDMMSEENVTI